MEIYLLRHGIAHNSRPGGSDADRVLTEDGIRVLEAVAARARDARVSPAAVLSSNYARAVQSAEIVARILGYRGPIERVAALQPSGSPFEAWDEIRAHHPSGPVLVTAHEPLLSGLAAVLLEAPTLRIQIGTASMLAIEVERLSAQPNGLLKWMITPALA
ncbi:MAG TPA: histidine phosphatase family protein [Bryobacteraceae bacterium]|nr:histidine phosphatase family protein [Bryobacteraceae bacterium]